MPSNNETSSCKLHRDGRTLVVEIDRKDVGNRLNPAANVELSAVFDDFEQDDTLDVAILTGGAGHPFCSGEQGDEAGEGSQPSTGFGGITLRTDATKPVIAAVEVEALGAGFELALACDLIVAGQTASFAMDQPYNAHAPRWGGAKALARGIPLQRAMSVLLTGRAVSAGEGVVIGFVNELAPDGRAVRVASKIAERIGTADQEAIRSLKRSLRTE